MYIQNNKIDHIILTLIRFKQKLKINARKMTI